MGRRRANCRGVVTARGANVVLGDRVGMRGMAPFRSRFQGTTGALAATLIRCTLAGVAEIRG
jgi:hypothetical protein